MAMKCLETQSKHEGRARKSHGDNSGDIVHPGLLDICSVFDKALPGRVHVLTGVFAQADAYVPYLLKNDESWCFDFNSLVSGRLMSITASLNIKRTQT